MYNLIYIGGEGRREEGRREGGERKKKRKEGRKEGGREGGRKGRKEGRKRKKEMSLAWNKNYSIKPNKANLLDGQSPGWGAKPSPFLAFYDRWTPTSQSLFHWLCRLGTWLCKPSLRGFVLMAGPIPQPCFS
jgi:hypothetical protein